MSKTPRLDLPRTREHSVRSRAGRIACDLCRHAVTAEFLVQLGFGVFQIGWIVVVVGGRVITDRFQLAQFVYQLFVRDGVLEWRERVVMTLGLRETGGSQRRRAGKGECERDQSGGKAFHGCSPESYRAQVVACASLVYVAAGDEIQDSEVSANQRMLSREEEINIRARVTTNSDRKSGPQSRTPH